MLNKYDEEKLLLNIVMPKFPTHLPYTRNKRVPDKYVKINGQTIYNGQMSRFSRNILMHNMHTYLLNYLKGIKIKEYPIRIELIINTVINHDSIQRRFNKSLGEYKITWKTPVEDYEPSNDVDNLSWVWIKAFNDALKIGGCIEDDNLKYIKGYSVDFEPVKELKDRNLNFKIYKV